MYFFRLSNLILLIGCVQNEMPLHDNFNDTTSDSTEDKLCQLNSSQNIKHMISDVIHNSNQSSRSIFSDKTYDFSKKQQNHDIYYENNKTDNYDVAKNVFYWLYTKEEPNGKLLDRHDMSTLDKSTFNPDNPTKTPIHGWHGNMHDKQGVCSSLVRSYLEIGSYNVICVDWKQLSVDISYPFAKKKSKEIGHDLADIILRLKNVNNSAGVLDNIHLIGHSLGAHIAGFAGKKLNNSLSRITGLDPAKPLFENSGPSERISNTDAHFVDIIHTNSGWAGLSEPIGDIDFFPNGGRAQPNCTILDWITAGSCSHVKSYHFFAHSIWAKEDYPSIKCLTYNHFKNRSCGEYPVVTFMGEFVNTKLEGAEWETYSGREIEMYPGHQLFTNLITNKFFVTSLKS